MRLSRPWLCVAVLLWSAGCASEPLSEGDEAPDVEGVVQALPVDPCSSEGLRKHITWNSADATHEGCTGMWNYARYGTCEIEDPTCPCPPSLGERCSDRTIRAHLDVTNIPKGECYWEWVDCEAGQERLEGSVHARAAVCRPKRVEVCEPDYGWAQGQCQQMAESHRANHPDSYIVGTPSVDGYVFKKSQGRYTAKCHFTLFQPKIKLTCQRKHPSCPSPGRATDQNTGVKLVDAQQSLGQLGTDLRCTTCDAHQLPTREPHKGVGHDGEELARKKLACLADTKELLPVDYLGARVLSDRAIVWLYEGWGDALTPEQRAYARALYANYDALPEVDYCPPEPTTIALPMTCPAATAAELNTTLRLCQRLSAKHVPADLQVEEFPRCRAAAQLMQTTPGCQSVAYLDALGEAILNVQERNGRLRDRSLETGTPSTNENTEATRWIRETVVGRAPKGYACPDPEPGSGWEGGYLFGVRPLSKQPLGEDGAIFCRYDYQVEDTGEEGQQPNVNWTGLPEQYTFCSRPGDVCSTVQPPVDGASWLHPDALIASAQAPEGVLAEIQARLAVEYLANMDAPLVGAPVANPNNKVALAILDSVGDSTNETWPLPGSGHGRALAMAAFRTACPGGLGTSCPVHIRQFRAYKQGTLASLSEVAVQIVLVADQAVANNQKAIVNLSMGIHPLMAWWDAPGTNTTFPDGVLLPAFAALKAAINYASARGVIVVAAAGNTDGAHGMAEGNYEQLLYPAAFDGQSGWQCDAARECTEQPRSLVIAAGGVTNSNRPLPNARFATQPVSMVAPGCNVAVDNALAGQAVQPDLPTYCGTSFGAIGVSTVLAATWAYLPNATPQQLVNVVRSAGVNIADGTTGCTGEGCRVRLCAALQAAGAAVTCRAAAAPEGASAPLPGADAFIDAHEVPVTWSGENDDSADDLECGSDVLHSSEDAELQNEFACPDKDFTTTVPDSEILVDCPGDPACPQCGVMFRNGPVGLIQPILVGTMQPTPHSRSPSLLLDAKTYEMQELLGEFLEHGGSFSISLGYHMPPQTPSDVSTLSYIRQPPNKRPTLHVDPVAVVR
jgi:hypothetical protein